MSFPKITIITPVLNKELDIEKVISSVGGQSYRPVEHIIINGASSDQTEQAVVHFQELYPHIRLLSEPDRGVYHAMNKGIDLCTGEWIIFMGAEDEFYDEQVLTDIHNRGLLKQEHIIYGNVIIRGDSPWAKDATLYDGPFDLEKLFKRNICHQAVFYPVSVVKEIGYYNEAYAVTADWDYNIRCFARYPFTYLDKVISYFQSGGTSSQGGDDAFYEDLPGNVIRYFNLDPADRLFYDFNSPFYGPVSRYREFELRSQRDNLLQIKRKYVKLLKTQDLSKYQENKRNEQLTPTQLPALAECEEKVEHLKWVLHLKEMDFARFLKDHDPSSMAMDEQVNELRRLVEKHEISYTEQKKRADGYEHELQVIKRSWIWKTGSLLVGAFRFLLDKVIPGFRKNFRNLSSPHD